jgi:hypothetical protein
MLQKTTRKEKQLGDHPERSDLSKFGFVATDVILVGGGLQKVFSDEKGKEEFESGEKIKVPSPAEGIINEAGFTRLKDYHAKSESKKKFAMNL